ncbi:ATP-binding protein [Herbidospora cretacea]|uniref:ATP-binding protein n=1 Tax=Herbidospora cretacea TaxID=28444 RepID=UPI0004C36683|nr:LuxR C-terminal-related transcriptional regulator [Herbidospora cretacea]
MTTEMSHSIAVEGNLPLEPNAFVGREPDVEELLQLMTAARVVTLCGVGGIGKSRLALRVAAELARDLPDGAWLVEFPEGTRPKETVRRIASVLGVEGEPGRDLGLAVAEVFAGRKAVIVLDNCETVVEECAQFTRRLAEHCPEVRVLATSREPLRVPGETVWRVPPLALPPDHDAGAAVVGGYESVLLFQDRAASARPGFTLTDDNAPDVSRLCHALDGMPLALELAAGMTRVLSIPQIVARLGDRFRLLSAGDRTAPPRQRTLRATVDWSYDLLTEPQRVLLRRATVFRSGWTLPMAELVCAGGPVEAPDVLGHLTALVDKSLVVVDGELAGEARYRLLDTIRQYAAEQLDGPDEEATRRRHRDFFVTFARDWEVAVDAGSWPAVHRRTERLERLQSDLRAAVDWSLTTGDAAPMLQALLGLRWMLLGSGRFQAELTRWVDRLVELARPDVDPATHGRALAFTANLLSNTADFAGARERARQALDLCRQAGDRLGEGQALLVLAISDGSQPAETRLEQSISIARAIGERVLEAEGHGTRAFLSLAQGRLREAQRSAERLVALATELDNHLALVIGLSGLGQTARRRGDLQAARHHFTRALRIVRTFDARQWLISCLAGLGSVALDAGDLPEARRRLGEALRLGRDAGLRLQSARRLETFAALYLRQGDPRRAVLLAAASAGLRTGRPGARVENVLTPAREALGETVVAALWAEGLALPFDAAVTLALEESAGSPAPVVAPVAVVPQSTLTAREREIAELVARGLSNRAIADELVISQATVARHVANILAKLGFTSRTQVATWVVEHGV